VRREPLIGIFNLLVAHTVDPFSGPMPIPVPPQPSLQGPA
jgi:hypothetical protein